MSITLTNYDFLRSLTLPPITKETRIILNDMNKNRCIKALEEEKQAREEELYLLDEAIRRFKRIKSN